MNNKEIIFEELSKLQLVIDQPQDPKRLELYSKMLSKLDFNLVIDAIQKCRYTYKFFPQLCEIIELTKPKQESIEDRSSKIAGEICSDIRNIGYNSYPGSIIKYMNIVNALGGPEYLMQLQIDQLPIVQAQARKLAHSFLASDMIRTEKKFDRVMGCGKLERLNFEIIKNDE